MCDCVIVESKGDESFCDYCLNETLDKYETVVDVRER